MSEKVNTLEWKNYPDHLKNIFHQMIVSPEYTDATLVSEDQKEFKVHRVILSACSSVFESIFRINSQSNAIVYLRGIEGQEIESILQFIYLGQTDLHQEKISEFLSVAKSLKIKEVFETVNSLAIDTKTVTGTPKETEKTEILYDFEEREPNLLIVDEKGFKYDEQVIPSISDTSENNSEFSESFESNHDEAVQDEFINKYINQLNKKCPHCMIEFPELDELKKHIVADHCNEKEMHICSECGKQFNNVMYLDKHFKRSHNQEKWPCNICGKEFSASEYLRKHVQTIHEDKMFQCKQCKSKFSHQATLRRHFREVHENGGRMYTCEFCEYTNKHANKLKQHVKVVHEGFRYSCQHCNYKAKRKDYLKTHTFSMHDGIRFYCDQCNYSGSKENLYTHRKNKHS